MHKNPRTCNGHLMPNRSLLLELVLSNQGLSRVRTHLQAGLYRLQYLPQCCILLFQCISLRPTSCFIASCGVWLKAVSLTRTTTYAKCPEAQGSDSNTMHKCCSSTPNPDRPWADASLKSGQSQTVIGEPASLRRGNYLCTCLPLLGAEAKQAQAQMQISPLLQAGRSSLCVCSRLRGLCCGCDPGCNATLTSLLAAPENMTAKLPLWRFMKC